MTTLSLVEEQAFQLSRCALALDGACQNRATAPGDLVAALNANLELWVAIRTLMSKDECGLKAETKANLIKLAEFVASRTFLGIDKLDDDAIRNLININLQISEGLLEGAKAS